MIVSTDNYLRFLHPIQQEESPFLEECIMFSVAKLKMPVLNVQEHRQKQTILLSFFFAQKFCFRNIHPALLNFKVIEKTTPFKNDRVKEGMVLVDLMTY